MASLAVLGTSTLWKDLRMNGDREWLLHEYSEGTLMFCHNGSYLPDKDQTCCFATMVVLGQKTGQLATATYCKYTDAYTASNYRGELIGGILVTLLLQVCKACVHCTSNQSLDICCDNLGVVSHGNNYLQPLPKWQDQQDVLSLLH